MDVMQTINSQINQWSGLLLAFRESAGLRHFCIGFTFQTLSLPPYCYAVQHLPLGIGCVLQDVDEGATGTSLQGV